MFQVSYFYGISDISYDQFIYYLKRKFICFTDPCFGEYEIIIEQEYLTKLEN